MTKKLYYQDSYIRTFEALVKACTFVEKGVEVILDQTAFFPESGGQYGDQGSLNNLEVLNVYERNKEIIHLLKEPLEVGAKVVGELDWKSRHLKMQQHSAEHIVSGLVKDRFGYDNVGFHLGTEDSTLDFNGEITPEQLRELEWCANEFVVANLDIIERYPRAEEIEQLVFRSKIELDEGLRIIVIPGVDQCACCAPQLKRTGEIGLIKLTNIQRHKGGVRITMLCGVRALMDYSKKEKSVKGISQLLSVKEDEVEEGVQGLKEEVESWKKKNIEMANHLIEYKVKEISEDGEICLFEYELKGDGPRHLMNAVLEQGGKICAVFYPDHKEGFRYTIGSKTIDVRPIGEELNEAFHGRGGGKANMIQGTVKGEETQIREWLRKGVSSG